MKENLQGKDSYTVPFWAMDLLKYIKQKLSADKVTVLQSRNEMKYLIDCICNASITNKQEVSSDPEEAEFRDIPGRP